MDKKPLIGQQPPPYPGESSMYQQNQPTAHAGGPAINQYEQPPPYYNGAFASPPAGWAPSNPPPPPPNYGSTIVVEQVSVPPTQSKEYNIHNLLKIILYWWTLII